MLFTLLSHLSTLARDGQSARGLAYNPKAILLQIHCRLQGRS